MSDRAVLPFLLVDHHLRHVQLLDPDLDQILHLEVHYFAVEDLTVSGSPAYSHHRSWRDLSHPNRDLREAVHRSTGIAEVVRVAALLLWVEVLVWASVRAQDLSRTARRKGLDR